MTYEQLRKLCVRALNLHPESKETVGECFAIASNRPRLAREACLQTHGRIHGRLHRGTP